MEYGVDHDVGSVPGYVVPTSFSKDRHTVWGGRYEFRVRAAHRSKLVWCVNPGMFCSDIDYGEIQRYVYVAHVTSGSRIGLILAE
jgi:hypothetical protein